MINKLLLTIFLSIFSLKGYSQFNEKTIDIGTAVTLQKAVLDLDANGTIHVRGTVVIDDDVVVPSGVVLVVHSEGRFVISNQYLLEIRGVLKAELRLIFDQAILFRTNLMSEINSEWFGNNDVAVNKALRSAGKIPVNIQRDISVSNTIFIDSGQTLLIEDGVSLNIDKEMKGNSAIANKNNTDSNIMISGGIINGTNAVGKAYDAILFNSVSDSYISNVSCINVHITASKDTGNFRLNDCKYVFLKNCNVTGTWKMGIFILNGSCNYVSGGKFYGTHDSAIGVVNSNGSTIDGLFVDNCGTSDGSNMSLSSENLLVINNKSINASGKRNGNGITLGHDNSPASNSICMDNVVMNNSAKGIFIQGVETKNIVIENNTIVDNGINSDGTNSGGIALYSNVRNHIIRDNTITGNRIGVSLHKNSQEISIIGNQINASKLYGIRNDGKNITIKGNYFNNSKDIHNGFNQHGLIILGNTKGLQPTNKN